MDIVSRKLFWLKVWIINFDLQLIGRWYLEYLFEMKMIFVIFRVDKGIEIGIMVIIYLFLCWYYGDMDLYDIVVYGFLILNQVCNIV